MKRISGALALLLGLNSADAQTFQYIYIEANEGQSSGGHVAVQFEDEVFHYQYTGSLIRLVRENAEEFRFDYRYLQNRTLHVADIQVSAQTFSRLQSHFKRQFWDQDRQFKRLQALENDRLLLEWLLALRHGASPAALDALKLPGAGLFYPGGEETISGECQTSVVAEAGLNQLRQHIRQQYGDEFLAQRLSQLQQEIRRLMPHQDSTSEYGFSQRYIDLLNGLLAVRVVLESRPLNADACYVFNAPEWRLDAAKTQVLRDYRQRLLKSARALLSSSRPDWGHALFVTLARLLVVQHSLQSGQWTFLDDFDADAAAISTDTYSRQQPEMALQRLAAQRQWQQNWHAISEDTILDDLRYADLEISANRYREWQSSLHSLTLRYQGQQPLPDKPLSLSPWALPDLSEPQLQQALAHLQVKLPDQAAELENQYAYHLMARNCVTEIFSMIKQALADETEQAWSRRIDPDLNFIPFMAFDSVQKHYPVINTQVLPSFRMRQLARQYEEEFAPWVFMRESNIFSAELYHYNPDDAAFLFFTDDGFLLRPLFGAFNSLTGLGQSLLGLIRLPLDDGAALNNGTRGLMMSLPELAFINIRKGSYKFDFSLNLTAHLSTAP